MVLAVIERFWTAANRTLEQSARQQGWNEWGRSWLKLASGHSLSERVGGKSLLVQMRESDRPPMESKITERQLVRCDLKGLFLARLYSPRCWWSIFKITVGHERLSATHFYFPLSLLAFPMAVRLPRCRLCNSHTTHDRRCAWRSIAAFSPFSSIKNYAEGEQIREK